jgi:hypothetical protein
MTAAWVRGVMGAVRPVGGALGPPDLTPAEGLLRRGLGGLDLWDRLGTRPPRGPGGLPGETELAG